MINYTYPGGPNRARNARHAPRYVMLEIWHFIPQLRTLHSLSLRELHSSRDKNVKVLIESGVKHRLSDLVSSLQFDNLTSSATLSRLTAWVPTIRGNKRANSEPS